MGLEQHISQAASFATEQPTLLTYDSEGPRKDGLSMTYSAISGEFIMAVEAICPHPGVRQ